MAVLHAVNAVLPIHVTWVCQNRPDEAHLPVLGRCNLTFDLHVNVPQVRVLAAAAMPEYWRPCTTRQNLTEDRVYRFCLVICFSSAEMRLILRIYLAYNSVCLCPGLGAQQGWTHCIQSFGRHGAVCH